MSTTTQTPATHFIELTNHNWNEKTDICQATGIQSIDNLERALLSTKKTNAFFDNNGVSVTVAVWKIKAKEVKPKPTHYVEVWNSGLRDVCDNSPVFYIENLESSINYSKNNGIQTVAVFNITPKS